MFRHMWSFLTRVMAGECGHAELSDVRALRPHLSMSGRGLSRATFPVPQHLAAPGANDTTIRLTPSNSKSMCHRSAAKQSVDELQEQLVEDVRHVKRCETDLVGQAEQVVVWPPCTSACLLARRSCVTAWNADYGMAGSIQNLLPLLLLGGGSRSRNARHKQAYMYRPSLWKSEFRDYLYLCYDLHTPKLAGEVCVCVC
eukprot:scpid104305/ scgid7596/ 